MDTDSLYVSVSGYPYLTEEEMMSIHDHNITPDRKKYLQSILNAQNKRTHEWMEQGMSDEEIARLNSCDQGIDAIITDKEFYNKWKQYFLPKKKTMMNVAIEHTGEDEINVSPKCYAFKSTDECIFKSKGFTVKNNSLTMKDYEDQVKGAAPLKQNMLQIFSNRASVVLKNTTKACLAFHCDKGVRDQKYCLVPYYSGVDIDTSGCK
jgi:hypothetical protein